MTPGIALAMIDARGDDAPWALAWLAAYNFTHSPDDLEMHEENILSHSEHIADEKGRNAKDLARRAMLAGTMGVTYALLGRETLAAVQKGETDIYFGPPECYVFYMPDGSGRFVVAPYYTNPVRDMFMRAVMMLADKAEHVRATFPQYGPVWSLEESIRQAIEEEEIPYIPGTTKQFAVKGLSTDPLDKERILKTASGFWRHAMHGLLIIGDGAESLEAAATKAHNSVEAFKAAAAFPKARQRQAMGVPTPSLAPYRPFTELCLTKDMYGRPRFNGLMHEPRKPSLCTGRGEYNGPEDWPRKASSIATLVELGTLVAKQTIWAPQNPC